MKFIHAVVFDVDEFNNSNYNMRNTVLQLKEGVLWVLINTRNSIREFERM